ncbi:MAG: hypothetical protein JNN15_13215 [Blastocatellia bacterium]|nr:hypothetical protein [Blastocatellia bacterium]
MTSLTDNLKKMEFAQQVKPLTGEERTMVAIFKVSEPGYCPEGVKVRARAGSYMFTGSFSSGLLGQIDNDPKVVSYSLSKSLRVID